MRTPRPFPENSKHSKELNNSKTSQRIKQPPPRARQPHVTQNLPTRSLQDVLSPTIPDSKTSKVFRHYLCKPGLKKILLKQFLSYQVQVRLPLPSAPALLPEGRALGSLRPLLKQFVLCSCLSYVTIGMRPDVYIDICV